MLTRYLFAGAAALALAACGGNEPEAQPSDANEQAMTDPMAASSPAAAGVTTGQAFVDTAAASDMFEIESSRLAADMAKDEKVKEFAAMMIDNHTKSTADLKAAASEAAPPLQVAPGLMPEQEADLAALRTAGAQFDKMYAAKQVAAHDKALAALQAYERDGDVASLKVFAAKTSPIVSQHLDHARKLPQ